MIIRAASIADLNELTRLFDGYRVWYQMNSDLEGAHEFLTERLEKQDSKIYVCDDGKNLAGFTQLYPLFSSTRMKRYWLLNDLFVDDNYRGKGLSVQLIDQAKDLVKTSGACGMFLETQKTNLIGNKLYPRAGFKLNETTNFYEWTSE
ncbi:MAG: GNAT family N-acetyltransferase [Ekhidna sp.]|nr:GNAT family N-acetyltransferase [Ekhidna sp.]